MNEYDDQWYNDEWMNEWWIMIDDDEWWWINMKNNE